MRLLHSKHGCQYQHSSSDLFWSLMFWPLLSVNIGIHHERLVSSLKACRLPCAMCPSDTLSLTQFSTEQWDWGNRGERVHRSFHQLGIQDMLEEVLRADSIPTWWKASAFGDVLQSTGGRWHLCRMNFWVLHTRYTEKANKLTAAGKRIIAAKVVNSCPQSFILISSEGAQAFEMLSPLVFFLFCSCTVELWGSLCHAD